MTNRRRKLLLLGAERVVPSSTAVGLNAYRWDELSKVGNVPDYDVVILNLLDLKTSTQIDWIMFQAHLGFSAVRKVLDHGGEFVVIGDPRFTRPPSTTGKEEFSDPFVNFLDWTAVEFQWDEQPGNTVENLMGWQDEERFGRYLSHLSSWEYSLRDVVIDVSRLDAELRKLSAYNNIDFYARADALITNRYRNALAFSLYIEGERTIDEGYRPTAESFFLLGPIVCLPSVGLRSEEALSIVLGDAYGAELTRTEPDWVGQINAAGQKEVDDQLTEVEEAISELRDRRQQLRESRALIRRPLGLLYEQGEALEMLVRDTLKQLGARVHEPESRDDDGWFEIEIDGEVHYGALEIKSTAKEQHRKDGLRQLDEWIDLLTEKHGVRFKGFFIGNSEIDKGPSKRRSPYASNWVRFAISNEMCAIKTVDLYRVYAAEFDHNLRREKFWRIAFETNGVLSEEALMTAFTTKDQMHLKHE